MKPTPLMIAHRGRRRLLDAMEHQCWRMPVTQYGYHSGAFGGFRGGYVRNPAQSFWNISGNYLKDEARHDFWSEATLFAVITFTAALPLLNNLHTLIEFVRAITFQQGF